MTRHYSVEPTAFVKLLLKREREREKKKIKVMAMTRGTWDRDGCCTPKENTTDSRGFCIWH